MDNPSLASPNPIALPLENNQIEVKKRKECELELETIIKDKTCELGLQLHIQKCGCELTLEHYICLKECNLSLEVIKCVYENGCALSIEDQLIAGGEDPEVILNTANGDYPIKNLKFDGDPNFSALEKYKVDLQKSEYMKNPDSFIKNINKDYSGN